MFEPLHIHALVGGVSADLSAAPHGILLLAAIALCLWAALSDLSRFIIPNAVSGLLFLAGLVWIWAVDLPWLDHLLAFVAVFTLGYACFALGVLGAGDGKLLAVLALWLGPFGAFMFLIYTALIGGVLALLWSFSGPARQALIYCGFAIDPHPPARVPYGIAIASAGVPALIGLWPLLAV